MTPAEHVTVFLFLLRLVAASIRSRVGQRGRNVTWYYLSCEADMICSGLETS